MSSRCWPNNLDIRTPSKEKKVNFMCPKCPFSIQYIISNDGVTMHGGLANPNHEPSAPEVSLICKLLGNILQFYSQSSHLVAQEGPIQTHMEQGCKPCFHPYKKGIHHYPILNHLKSPQNFQNAALYYQYGVIHLHFPAASLTTNLIYTFEFTRSSSIHTLLQLHVPLNPDSHAVS